MVVINHQLWQQAFSNMFVKLAGRDIATLLVHSLVARYFKILVNTDAIRNKLCNFCPGLYRAEDAANNAPRETNPKLMEDD